MNVYHRLLNILAETSQPEYWTIDELVHCLELSQRQFVKDTKVIKKHKGLVPAFDENEPASRLPVTMSTVLNEGLYQIPDDCLEIRNVYYRGKLLDKTDIDSINANYAGNSYFLGLKGSGLRFYENWRKTLGEPAQWVYDGGIRIIPREYDEVKFLFITLTEYDLDLERVEYDVNDIPTLEKCSNCNDCSFKKLIVKTSDVLISNSTLYWQFARLLKYVDGTPFYDEGAWEKLEYNKDYFLSSSKYETRILFSDEILCKMCDRYNGFTVLPTLLIINPSKNATIDYIPDPKIEWDIKTLNDKGVKLQISPVHSEAVACYAAYLALSKEGKKSQDIEKATIYLQRYQEYALSVKLALKGSVNLNYEARLPFKV